MLASILRPMFTFFNLFLFPLLNLDQSRLGLCLRNFVSWGVFPLDYNSASDPGSDYASTYDPGSNHPRYNSTFIRIYGAGISMEAYLDGAQAG